MISTITAPHPAPSLPRICILTGHSEEQLPLALITIYSNMAEYALSHGYDLVILRGSDPKHEYFPLFRLREIFWIATARIYDCVYVVGADVMITNMTIPLSQFIDDKFKMVLSTDCNGWQSDSMLVSRPAAGFIDEVITRFDEFKDSKFKEQDGMFEIAKAHPGLVKVLPQRAMNSYNYDLYPARGGRDGKDIQGNDGQWQPGDFLIHWAGLPLDVRLEQAEKMEQNVVR